MVFRPSLIVTDKPTRPLYKSLLANPEEKVDPEVYQERIIQEYLKRSKRKNWAARTINNQEFVVRQVILQSGKLIWELLEEDIDKYVDAQINGNLCFTSRRKNVSTFRAFYEWFIRNYSTEIWNLFRIHLFQPVTEDNQIKHSYDLEHDFKIPPPSREMINYFFKNLRKLIGENPKGKCIARNYTIFKLMYNVGPRINEVLHLDLADLYFDSKKIHIRYGKGAKGSGKRERWLPMLNDTEQLLKWYLKYVRPLFKNAQTSRALFPSLQSERVIDSTISQSLSRYQALLGIPEHLHWSAHKFRHGFASHNYENGMRLLVLKDLLGHASIYTTMIYVTPSVEYVEQNIRIVNSRLKEKYNDTEEYLPWQ